MNEIDVQIRIKDPQKRRQKKVQGTFKKDANFQVKFWNNHVNDANDVNDANEVILNESTDYTSMTWPLEFQFEFIIDYQ